MTLPLPARADSFSSSDLFSELEESTPLQETPRHGILNEIYDNAEYKMIYRGVNYYNDAHPRLAIDNNPFSPESKLEIKTSLKRGSDLLSLFAWGDVGFQKDTYSQRQYGLGTYRADDKIERMRRYFELNEFHWVHSWSSIDLTIGKKIFKMGVCPIYSPSNRINPVDLNDPLNFKEYGIWQTTIDYFKGSTTVTAAFFPFFIPSKFPSPRSRWSSSINPPQVGLTGPSGDTGTGTSTGTGAATGTTNNPRDAQFFNFQVDPLVGVAADFPSPGDSLQSLARIKTTVKGWDLFAASFTGVAPYPVLRSGNLPKGETPLVREYITANNTSFGFSTTFKKFEFHGEGLFQASFYHKDDDYFAYVVGTTYTVDDWAKKIFLDKIDLTFDWANEAILDRQGHAGYLEGSRNLRQAQRDILLKAVLEYSEDIRFGFLMDLTLDEDARTYAFGVEYKIRDGLVLKVSSEFFHGPDNSFFGRWRSNSRLLTSLEYSF